MRNIGTRGNCFRRASSWAGRIRTGLLALTMGVMLAGSLVWAAMAPQADSDPVFLQKMQQGAGAMSAKNFSEAVADYTAATHEAPRMAEGYFNLGLALQQDGQLQAATAALEKSLVLQPNLRGADLFLGLIAYRQNHLRQAESRLLRETRIDPRDAKAYMWLGVCYLAEGKPEEAIPPLNRAYALDPHDSDILYHRGHAYLLMANASYSAMFKLDHDSMRVHQVLAEAYATGYRTQQAISEFQIAIGKAPHEPGLHEELANQYWIAGQLDKAAAAYRQELQIDPYSAVTMYKLGCLLVLNNQPAAGVKLLNSALHDDPSLTDAHYYLGSGLVSLGRSTEAITEFKDTIAANPSGGRAERAWYKLAMIYRNNGEVQAARDSMQKFLALKSHKEAQQSRNTAQIAQSRMALPVADSVPDSNVETRRTAKSSVH